MKEFDYSDHKLKLKNGKTIHYGGYSLEDVAAIYGIDTDDIAELDGKPITVSERNGLEQYEEEYKEYRKYLLIKQMQEAYRRHLRKS